MDYFSGFKADDKKDIKGLEPERSGGTEVAGKKGIPVGAREAFPGKRRLDVPGLSVMPADTANSFVGDDNGQFF
ncbi:MAG: hypothetical protein LBJ31_04250 [Treponema sp.]|jgi:hypothetical protein|nr:hypothetical protein [Treponema sp.]